jgi:diguanylate cyclase (GGDEF)-like protein
MQQGRSVSFPQWGSLRWLTQATQHEAEEIRTLLTSTFLQRTAAVVLATINVMVLAAITGFRTGATWPLVWLTTDGVLLIVRLLLIRACQKARPLGAAGPMDAMMSVGLLWSFIMGLGCAACVMTGDILLIALASIHVTGISAGISARNAAVPRYAMTQILLCGTPLTVAAAGLSSHSLWILAIETPVFMAGMCSVVQRQYHDTVSLIRAERQNTFLAFHDALTGLPNRVQFHEQLLRILTETPSPPLKRRQTAVLYLDLDGFKAINDLYSHAVGDALLCEVSNRLRSAVAQKGFASRLSGDEFAVFLADVTEEDACRFAQGLIASISAPCTIGAAEPVMVGASIGIALSLQHGNTPDALLSFADRGLYASKRLGKGTYRIFDGSLPVAEPAGLNGEVRAAIRDRIEEFVLHYQPIFCLETGTIIAREALLRWRHPLRGLLPPLDFIDLVEESGLIVPLGEWVIRCACRDAARWSDRARVAVNVSPKQLGGRGLPQAIAAALADTGLPVARLEIEVTETIALDRGGMMLADLHLIRDLGVSVALDDFGVAYSSLSLLQRFPFDRIKIDRCFVHDVGRRPKSAAILNALAGLGQELGVQVTAEGIETPEDLAVARASGCSDGQGFLLGQPMAQPELGEAPAWTVAALGMPLQRRSPIRPEG